MLLTGPVIMTSFGEFLMKEITDKSLEELNEKMLDNLVTWQLKCYTNVVTEVANKI